MSFPEWQTGQANPEIPVTEAFDLLKYAAVYGRDPDTTSALTWGYLGGRWGGFAVTAGMLTLTNTATNYIVVARATGVASVSTGTTNWNNATDYARVYALTVAGGLVTATADYRAGDGGLFGSSAGGGGGSSTLAGLSDVDVTGVSDGDVLTYDSATTTWIPLAPSGGGGAGNGYGVYASRPSASTAGAGFVYYGSDTSEAYRSNGSTWDVVPSGGTELGYAEISTTFSTASVSFVDVTGLSFSAVATERPMVLEVNCHGRNDAGAGNALILGLYANGALIQGEKAFWMTGTSNYRTSYSRARIASGVLTPGNSYNFKLALRTNGVGTAEVYADATWQAFLRLITG